ncbi:PIN domain-containing protein [Patulibacter defluvii]|uniref:PIN domain-containing protein n=1 Tax=Patulibacter defluvii TaxID=3095358 RepID=UPI002A761499|nr:PIN domain-containing protein [Patulibacter sp. DM4]
MSLVALDTSVAVPLLMRSHTHHAIVRGWWQRRRAALAGHAFAETYSVLTRLPADSRFTADDAARLLSGSGLEPPLLLDGDTSLRLPEILAERNIGGGAVYDALVALAAVHHDVPLATRDARARSTYDRIGARVVFVAGPTGPPTP